jgi:hypothetical protein
MARPPFKARLLPLCIFAAVMSLLWMLNPDPSAPDVRVPAVSFDSGRRISAPRVLAAEKPDPPTATVRDHDPAMRLASIATAQLREWQNEDNPKLRDLRANDLAALLRGADLRQVADLLPADVLDFALGLPVFQNWMASNPSDAARWMSHHPSTAETRVSTLIQNWNHTDAAAVRKYAEELPAGAWRQEVVAVIARQTLKTDPKEAIEWADDLSPGPVQTGLLKTAITAWGHTDLQTAAAWVSQIGDPVLKDQLTESLAVTYADANPEAAINFAVESLQTPAFQANAIADIAAVWAARAPERASQWTEQLPEGDVRRMALSEVIHAWGAHDPSAVAGWIDGMPQGSMRDEAIHFFETLTDRPADAVDATSAVHL